MAKKIAPDVVLPVPAPPDPFESSTQVALGEVSDRERLQQDLRGCSPHFDTGPDAFSDIGRRMACRIADQDIALAGHLRNWLQDR